MPVSILVLLDWEWRRAWPRGSGPVVRVFQSLFCWIGNGGTTTRGPRHETQTVSILVLLDWEWRRGRHPPLPGAPGHVSILVLLDWEWRHRGRHRPARGRQGVSILVLLDWEWRQRTFVVVDESHQMFQSLFCWIGNGGLPPRALPPRALGVSILVLLDWEWRHFKPGNTPTLLAFQSLFCWIGNGGPPYA